MMNARMLAVAALLAATPATAQQAWPGLSNASSWSFASNRLSFPALANAAQTVGLGHVTQTSPPYAVANVRFLFANFAVPTVAQSPVEVCPGNPKTVDFATVFIGGTAHPVTFGGASTAVIGDCEFVWSDPLRTAAGAPVTVPAGTVYAIRSSQSVAPGQVLTYGMDYTAVAPRFSNWTTGDGVEYTSAVQTAKRTSGTVAAFSGGSSAIGPAMAIGTGWDGSPVYMVAGDSIAAGQNDIDYTAAGITGYIPRALDDAGSTRRNFAVLAVPGTRPTDQASTATGQFRLRDRVLRSIPNRPFNRIVTNMGNNSLALPHPQFQAAMRDYWAFLRDLGGPNTPIVQTTYGPQTSQGGNSWYTNAAEQVATGAVSGFPDGLRWKAVGWLRSGIGVPTYVTVIDVTTTAFADPVDPGKFRPVPGAWTSAADIPVGVGLSTPIQVAGATAPAIGDHYVIEPGTANAERLQAYRVTGTTSPWSVYLTGNTARIHPAGTPILAAPTVDGTHLGATPNKVAAAVLIARKLANTLP